jgi:hypothetical protein
VLQHLELSVAGTRTELEVRMKKSLKVCSLLRLTAIATLLTCQLDPELEAVLEHTCVRMEIGRW